MSKLQLHLVVKFIDFPEVKDILKGLFWMDLQNMDPQKIWVPGALGLLIWT